MIIYPAIDIREGRVVRLLHGNPDDETVFGTEPVETARRWIGQGAEWLHIVNLDGALGEAETALDKLRDISALGTPVQFGGGLRTLADIERALEAGASRVVLGTMAVREPALAGEAVRQFDVESIAVALDARDGMVATHGWQEVSTWTPTALGTRFAEMGVKYALYTDITRDGAMTGVNVEATALLAKQTDLDVIASGGVSSLDDVEKLVMAGINGVVIGKAIYTDEIDLTEAIRTARGQQIT